jgi:hypothetical protein
MPLPVVFASLPQGDNPASLLDTQFNAVAGFTTIPCQATVGGSANQLELQPFEDAPTVTVMSDLAPAFTFVAPVGSTGNVTANVAGLGEFPVYKDNGAVLVTGGDLVAGGIYTMTFSSTLDGGAGGFSIDVLGLTGAGPLELYGPLSVNETLPADAAHAQIFTNTYVTDITGRFSWNVYESPGTILRYWQTGPGGFLSVMPDGSLEYQVVPSGAADAPVPTPTTLVTVFASGQTRFYGPVSANETMPANASHAEFFASNYVASGNLAFNIYTAAGIVPSYWNNGPGGELSMMSDGGLQYSVVPSGTAGAATPAATPVLSVSAKGVTKTSPGTVGALPTAASAGVGSRAFVTDATSTAFGAAATGGGGNAVPVFSNGSAWLIG